MCKLYILKCKFFFYIFINVFFAILRVMKRIGSYHEIAIAIESEVHTGDSISDVDPSTEPHLLF